MKNEKPTSRQSFDEIYDKVYELVQQGLTIQKALSRLEVNSRTFYRQMSREQSAELSIAKMNELRPTNKDYDYYRHKTK